MGVGESIAGTLPNRNRWRFPVRFLFLIGLGVGLGGALTPLWPAITAALAVVVVQVCNHVGIRASLAPGSAVVFEGGAFSYTIIGECTALSLVFVFTAAVLAYPATRRQRVVGLLWGVPLLLALNLIRLVTLAWVGLRFPQLFTTVHVYWWQGFLIAFVGFGWFAWARFIVHAGARSKGGTARAREIFGALGVFFAVVGGLGALGSVGGARAYRSVFQPLAYTIIGSLQGVIIRSQNANVFTYFQWSYASVVAVIGLFLATPRVRWKRKIHGTLLIGLPTAVGIEIVHFMIVFWMGGFQGIEGASITFVLFASRITLAVVVWYMWARNDWARAFLGRQGYRCPSCGAAREDLLAHVQRIHKRRLAEVLPDVFKNYPELRIAKGRIGIT